MASKLEKQVLRLIGESTDSPDVFSDISEIRESITDAIEEIAMVSGGNVGTYQIPLIADQTFYRINLSADTFAFVIDLWDQSRKRRLTQTDLIFLNRTQPRWMEDSSNPWSYFQIGHDLIGIWPKASASSGTLEMKCATIPAPYDRDNARIKVRDDYRWSVVNYAASEYFASVGQTQRAVKYFQDYLHVLGDVIKMPKALEKLARLENAEHH